jgi:hypothetical protein
MVKGIYVKAQITFYEHERGGRPFVPIRDGYAPYLRVEGSIVDLPVRVIGMPLNGRFGVAHQVELELMYPSKLDYGTLVEGCGFKVVEGPKIVGEGVVLSSAYER